MISNNRRLLPNSKEMLNYKLLKTEKLACKRWTVNAARRFPPPSLKLLNEIKISVSLARHKLNLMKNLMMSRT